MISIFFSSFSCGLFQTPLACWSFNPPPPPPLVFYSIYTVSQSTSSSSFKAVTPEQVLHRSQAQNVRRWKVETTEDGRKKKKKRILRWGSPVGLSRMAQHSSKKTSCRNRRFNQTVMTAVFFHRGRSELCCCLVTIFKDAIKHRYWQKKQIKKRIIFIVLISIWSYVVFEIKWKQKNLQHHTVSWSVALGFSCFHPFIDKNVKSVWHTEQFKNKNGHFKWDYLLKLFFFLVKFVKLNGCAALVNVESLFYSGGEHLKSSQNYAQRYSN